MNIQVWAIQRDAENKETSREDFGVKSLGQLKDFLVDTIEISDAKMSRIETAMDAGEEFLVEDDEGSFTFSDIAFLLVPLSKKA